MTAITSKNLVAFALAAIVSVALFTSGCSREGEPAESAAPSTAVKPRMEDPEYKAAIDGNLAAQNKLRNLQSSLAARLREREGAVRESLGSADDAAVKAALESDAEYKSLKERLDDAGRAIRDEQRHAAEIVRRKIFSDLDKDGQTGDSQSK